MRAEADKPQALTAELVRAYLRRNPAFLCDHPELLESLKLPVRREGDNIVDFQAFAIGSLQERVATLDVSLGDVLAAARSNVHAQGRIYEAALAALAAPGPAELLHIVTGHWPDILGFDVVVLAIEGDSAEPPAESGVAVLEAGTVDELLPDEESIVLRRDLTDEAALYGPTAPLVKADALVRLEPVPGIARAVLALGSRYADAAPAGGGEGLRFLAAVLSHCLRHARRKEE